MKKNRKEAVSRTERLAIKQKRGIVTYDTLIDVGFTLIDTRDIEDITIAELALTAGYSVGAFYARFRSKDEFFDALIARHLENRTETQSHLLETLPRKNLINDLIFNVVNYYWDHHVFWRAVLRRTLRDPAYWQPFRQHFIESTDRFVERIQSEIKRPLKKEEIRNITFAFQTIMGTINIAIVNQPGPVFIGQKLFIEELTRAFRLIADLDHLLSRKKA